MAEDRKGVRECESTHRHTYIQTQRERDRQTERKKERETDRQMGEGGVKNSLPVNESEDNNAGHYGRTQYSGQDDVQGSVC